MSEMDDSVLTLDLTDATDLSSSVVLIENESELSSREVSPAKTTPASKRKRKDVAAEEAVEKLTSGDNVSDSDDTNSAFIEMERQSPEPRRKHPTPLVTPQKNSVEFEDQPAAVPDIVKNVNFDDNLPETVTLLRWPNGGKVYIVGTAHFSEESQNDVATVIRAVQPDRVVVELCSSRTEILLSDEETVLAAARDLNSQKILNIMRSNGVVQGFLYVSLLTMSANITQQLGMAPGGEFRCAFREAEKIPGTVFLLGDRPINITMSRLLASLSWWQCLKLFWHFLFTKEKIKKEDVENAKKKDFLEAMLAEMAGEFPSMTKVLVTERDKFLTYSLQNAVSSNWQKRSNLPTRVVGIVGMGHVAGIKEHWGTVSDEEVYSLLEVPPPSITSRVIRTSFRLALLGGAAYLVYRVVPFQRIINSVRP